MFTPRIILYLFVLSTLLLKAQRHEFGSSFGATNYFGDLNHEQRIEPDFGYFLTEMQNMSHNVHYVFSEYNKNNDLRSLWITFSSFSLFCLFFVHFFVNRILVNFIARAYYIGLCVFFAF